jgi:hypothetical protein
VIAASLRVALFGFAFLLVMVNVHEIGHTVVARLLGDVSAHYVLYQAEGRSSCMGCNFYDSSRLGDGANVLVNFGGVIFTQLLCWTAILLLARRDGGVLKRWMLLSAIGMTWALDVILQLVQGLYADIPGVLPRGPESTYTDYLAVVWFIREQTGADQAALKVGLFVGTLAYSALLLIFTRWALHRSRST